MFFCSCPVLASNLLILTHRRENIDKLFLVNSYLPGCCIAKIASRQRHLFVLCTQVWKLSIAVQCFQNVDKLLQVNDDVFVAKGYEHIWASSGHRLKLAFCGCHTDLEARADVPTASQAPAQFTTRIQSLNTQYIARIHIHYTPSLQLEYTVTIPPVHRQNTQSLYLQFTTRLHSHNTPSLQLEFNTQSLHPQYIAGIYSHYTSSLQLEHTVTIPPVYNQNTQSLYPQFTARIHCHYTPSTQLEYTVTIPPVHSQNTQLLYLQFTTRIHSHYTPSLQLECTVKHTQYTAKIQ